MANKSPNTVAPSSFWQTQVAATAGLAAFDAPHGGTGLVSVQLRLHAAGTLVYTNRYGDVVTLTEMPAGIESIEAQAIGTGTNVKVTVYC